MFTAGALLLAGGAPFALCVRCLWLLGARSRSCCVVELWRTLCVVCAVSMAPWRSFTAGAMLLGYLCTLCVVCAVFMAPWRSFTAGVVLLNGGAPCV